MARTTLLALAMVLLTPLAILAQDNDLENEKLRKEIDELKVRLLKAEDEKAVQKVGLQKQLEELDRLQKDLLKQLELAQQERKERLVKEVENKTLRERLERLEQQVQKLSRELARAQAKTPVERTNDNPPTEKIEGRVLQVDKESGLILLNIGGDAGLKVGHTLQLFRIDAVPEKSKYLGALEIIKVGPKEAVARPFKKLQEQAKTGDRVASQLLDDK